MALLFPDVMLDIETISDQPDAVVLSIAATAFDSRSDLVGPSLHIYLNLDDQIRAGRSVTGGTFLWWLDQGEEARQAQVNAERLPFVVTHIKLRSFFEDNAAEGATVWSKSPSFDCVILKSLLNTLAPAAKLPWKFRDEEDVRGVVKRAGTEHVRADTAHDALSDNMAQIASVRLAVAALDKAFGRG